MQAILAELQGKPGVIGSFVMGEKSRAIAHSSLNPDKLGIELRQKLYKFSELTYKNNPFDYIISEGETGKTLVYNLNGKLLVILLSTSANPLVIHSLVKRNLRKMVEKPAEKAVPEAGPEIEKAKPKLEKGGKEILCVNTSGYSSHLDLILHLRRVYGDKRFLATRFLEFNDKELGDISREMRISVEAIKDLIARDPAIFSIKFKR